MGGDLERWGCPIWQNEAAYSDATDWDERQWAWEFKRRHYSTRNIFQFRLYRQLNIQNPLGKNSERADLFTSLIFRDRVMWREEHRDTIIEFNGPDSANFGLTHLPNPLYSDALTKCDAATSSLHQNLALRTIRFHDIVNRELNEFGESGLLGVTQIAVIFSPNQPIEPQLVGLEDHIKKFRRVESRDLKKRHVGKWLRYLRILDAREQGASWSECARHLLKGTAATPQTAADTYKQAVKVMVGL